MIYLLNDTFVQFLSGPHGHLHRNIHWVRIMALIHASTTEQSAPSSGQAALPLSIKTAQTAICQDFWHMVQHHSPELVLGLFERLFVEYTDHSAADLSAHLYTIVMGQHQTAFEQTLKSVYYILINTWQRQQQPAAIQTLLHKFDKTPLSQKKSTPFSRRLRFWLRAFLNSQTFHTIEAYAAGEQGWAGRYQAYLLIDQYSELQNQPEHRESARLLAQHLKFQFQFDLAKYASLAKQHPQTDPAHQNPTAIGDTVIPLIKQLLLRRERLNYQKLAEHFRQQSQQMTYGQYKQNLIQYLRFGMQSYLYQPAFYGQLETSLKPLECSHEGELMNDRLAFKACKLMIDQLTTSEPRATSTLFIQGASQGNALAMVFLLLKLVLICPQGYSHLEHRLTDLIHCFETQAEADCQWFIHFIEIFRITFAIYTGHQCYTLVKVGHAPPSSDQPSNQTIDLNTYRIFAQQRAAG